MSHIVDEILPSEEIHLIAGASGVGKTTWMLQVIDDWRQGKPILGRASHPAPFVYISCDRSRRSIERTLARIGLDPTTIPCIDGRGGAFDTMVDTAKRAVPSVRVLFIEAVKSIAPKATSSSEEYRVVANFLIHVMKRLESEHITMIGTTHSPKFRPGEKYEDPRSMLSGTTAWGAFCETLIWIERVKPDNPKDNRRNLWLMPRNSPDETFSMRLDERGRFIDATDEVDNFLLTAIIKDLPYNEDIPLHIIRQVAETRGVPERTMFRWLDQAVESGALFKAERGVYRKRRPA